MQLKESPATAPQFSNDLRRLNLNELQAWELFLNQVGAWVYDHPTTADQAFRTIYREHPTANALWDLHRIKPKGALSLLFQADPTFDLNSLIRPLNDLAFLASVKLLSHLSA